MVDFQYNRWQETVSRVSKPWNPMPVMRDAIFGPLGVVALDNGHVVGRLGTDAGDILSHPEWDPAWSGMYFSTENTPLVDYSVDFSFSDDQTIAFDYVVEDAILAENGAKILFTFAHDGRAHFVTGRAGETTVRIFVVDPTWTYYSSNLLGPGVYTVDIGFDVFALQWHLSRGTGKVKFIEATPDFTNYDVNVFVGEFEVPSSAIQRYSQVWHGLTHLLGGVIPSYGPKIINANTTSHFVEFSTPVEISDIEMSGPVHVSVEHLSQTNYWGFEDEWTIEDTEWVHTFRRVWIIEDMPT